MKTSTYSIPKFHIGKYILHMLLLDFFAAIIVYLAIALYGELSSEFVEYDDLFGGLLWAYIIRGIYHCIFVLCYNKIAIGTGGVEVELLPQEADKSGGKLHSFSICRIGLGSYMKHLLGVTAPALILLGIVFLLIMSVYTTVTFEEHMGLGNENGSFFHGIGYIFFVALLIYPLLAFGHLSFVVTYNLIAAKTGGIPVSVSMSADDYHYEKTLDASEEVIEITIVDEDQGAEHGDL